MAEWKQSVQLWDMAAPFFTFEILGRVGLNRADNDILFSEGNFALLSDWKMITFLTYVIQQFKSVIAGSPAITLFGVILII